MGDRETARMRKYGESKTTRIMMATVPHITSGLGLRKLQADGFLLTRVYTLTVQNMWQVSTYGNYPHVTSACQIKPAGGNRLKGALGSSED